jgi:hypothetical protein
MKNAMIPSVLLLMILNLPASPSIPSRPTLLSPVQGQTAVAPTPRFSWQKASKALTYEIQIASDSGFKTPIRDTSNVMDTNYNETKSLHFSTYYWRVRAKGAKNVGNWSESRVFTTEMVRHIFNWSFAAHNGNVTGDIKEKLLYFHRLGYNYVLSYLDYTQIMPLMAYCASGQDSGHWVFNKHHYADQSKAVVGDFIALKSAVETCGLHLMPAIGDLSHQGQWIYGTTNDKGDTIWKRNNALSEFNSPKDLLDFAHAHGLWPNASNNMDSCNKALNGIYCADDSNKTASDIFIEQLKIIQANWGSSTPGGLYPQYINIGHDEMGFWADGKFLCGVGEGKTKESVKKHGGGALGKSWVIAHQIKTKYGQVGAHCDPGVKIILWGDCFIPLNNGQSGGLTGDKTTGNGAILQVLRDTMQLTNNCIVEPWNYWYVKGTPVYDGIVFDQATQLKYIQKFGFGYVLASGEGEVYFDANKKEVWGGMANVKQHIRVAFEQVRASLEYPNNLYGYGNMLYQPNLETAGFNDTLGGYTAPILAYFGWTLSGNLFSSAKFPVFTPQVYAKFDPITSRKNLTWVLGKDYTAP